MSWELGSWNDISDIKQEFLSLSHVFSSPSEKHFQIWGNDSCETEICISWLQSQEVDAGVSFSHQESLREKFVMHKSGPIGTQEYLPEEGACHVCNQDVAEYEWFANIQYDHLELE